MTNTDSKKYTDPKTVLTPKGRIKNLEVIYDGGEDSWSLARMLWDNAPIIGMRWNGGFDNGKPSIGMPSARGYATWFVVPSEVGDAIENMLRFKNQISAKPPQTSG
jgi:hypothetical protein